MDIGELIGYGLTFIGGGGIAAIAMLRINKKKATVEVKVDEISALHDIIEKVYEPTIEFQKTRIKELESEVSSLKEQLSKERTDRQKEMELMNRRIVAITNALGLKATQQIRDDKGRFVKLEEDEA